MPRAPRIDIGGVIYHVLNRAVAARRLFEAAGDYQSFERVLAEAQAHTPVRLFSYCVMPTHWHLVLAPETDGGLSAFMAWLTMTHTQRWHTHHKSVGTGHLYQGRFKSFPIQADGHFLTVCRYVERNPLRAALVRRAEDWQWGSLWRRAQEDVPAQEGVWSPICKAPDPFDLAKDAGSRAPGTQEGVWSPIRKAPDPFDLAGSPVLKPTGPMAATRPAPTLSPWPVPRPANWLEFVNEPQSETEVSRIRKCVARGTPCGETAWAAEIRERFNGRGQEP